MKLRRLEALGCCSVSRYLLDKKFCRKQYYRLLVNVIAK